ncbi:MAG TPA: hypothetical protein VFZ49_06335 [Pyrinomonadaceae bacterium]
MGGAFCPKTAPAPTSLHDPPVPTVPTPTNAYPTTSDATDTNRKPADPESPDATNPSPASPTPVGCRYLIKFSDFAAHTELITVWGHTVEHFHS